MPTLTSEIKSRRNLSTKTKSKISLAAITEIVLKVSDIVAIFRTILMRLQSKLAIFFGLKTAKSFLQCRMIIK